MLDFSVGGIAWQVSVNNTRLSLSVRRLSVCRAAVVTVVARTSASSGAMTVALRRSGAEREDSSANLAGELNSNARGK